MIRAADPGDAAAMASIWAPVVHDTTITFTTEAKTAGELAERLAAAHGAGQGAFVAEVAGAVVGFAFYGPFRSGPGYRFTVEHTIVLAPTARGKGLGRALMTTLLDHAAGAGMRCMIGAVSGENPGGLAFHRALGFSDTAVLAGVGWKFGRPLDLHLMTRNCAG